MTDQFAMDFPMAAEADSESVCTPDMAARKPVGSTDLMLASPSAPSEAVPASSTSASTAAPSVARRAAAHSIPRGAERPATLRACLEHVTAQGHVGASQLTDMRSAIARLEKIVQTGTTPTPGGMPVDLPVTPEALRPILNNVMPALHRISLSRWRNIRSAITSLLVECGWVCSTARSSAPLTGAWPDLLLRAGDNHSAKPLPPFARYCAARNLGPEDVTALVLTDYENWRRQQTLTVNPRGAAQEVKISWNRLAKAAPDLGLVLLRTESRVLWKAARIEALPATFVAELDAYLDQLRHPDRLNPRHGRKCAELTVQHARRALLRAAAYLGESGTPLSEITALSALVEPAAFRTILELADAANPKPEELEDTWSYLAVILSGTLIKVARQWVDLAPTQLSKLEVMHRMVKAPRGGLSRRNRDRLAQFAEDDERWALLELPKRGFAQADKLLIAPQNGQRSNKGYRAAKLHETTLALQILLIQPLRRYDLASLDIAKHLRRDRRGKIKRLVIQTHKTRREIDAIIPPGLASRIDRHLAVFRPMLPGAGASTALFPGEGGGSRQPDALGRQITKLVARQLGAKFSPHLARHLIVETLLDADPNNMVVAQRLLGHGTLSRTQEMYGVTRTSAAQKVYLDLVEELRDKAAARGRTKRKPGQ